MTMQHEFYTHIQPVGDGTITIVELHGYLDAYTAPGFDDVLAQLFEGGQTRIVVDCAELDYISSAGLGVFMGHIEPFRSVGGDIVLCGLSPRITAIVEMLGFPHIFRICANREQAIAAFGQTPGTT